MSIGSLGRKNTRGWRGIAEWPRTIQMRTRALVVFLVFVVLVAAVTEYPELPSEAIGYDISSQAVAQREVRSSIYFKAVVLQATEANEEEAAALVPDIYRVDRDRAARQIQEFDDRVRATMAQREGVEAAVREALLASDSSQPALEVAAKAATEFAAKLKETPEFSDCPDASTLAAWLMPAASSLPERVFDVPADGADKAAPNKVIELAEPSGQWFRYAYAEELARLARESLQYVLTRGVMSPSVVDRATRRPITIMRENPVGDLKSSDEILITDVVTPAKAEELLTSRIIEIGKTMAAQQGGVFDWARLQTAALEMAKPFITDTLFFHKVATEAARERARKAVPPVMKEVQPGEVIQRSGDRWTAQSKSDVLTFWQELSAQREPWMRVVSTLLAHMIFVALVMASLVRSVSLLSGYQQNTARNINLVFLVMCATVILGRAVSYFDPTGFLVPSAAGAILLAILINPRVGVATSVLTTTLVSIQYGYDWRLLVVGGAMSLAGVFGLERVRRRSDMTGAAVKATIAGLLAALAISLAMDSITSESSLRRLLLVALNGASCLFIVPGVLSPIEKLFGITTDIQLLEYSDLNNEVLGRMAIEMPATYAHSLMLGQLAEAAADAIGANGLLARVCAYYHDIGKLRRPDYFSENQTGVNVHDDMPPRLSARAIASHVNYGVEVAAEHRLPQPIIAAIREHHGTCTIGFFYQKALEREKNAIVREEDYRYPGPRPQSRETAILMICDAVESGIRSIKNPNEERVREFIDKIIIGRSSDRQFDESGLTLKDLDIIRDVLTRRMVSALHPRVAYPDRTADKRADNVISLGGGAP